MSVFKSLEPVNVSFPGKRVLADVIKGLEMKISSWVIRVDPESNDKCACKRKSEGDMRRTLRRPRADGGRTGCCGCAGAASVSADSPGARWGGTGRDLPENFWRKCGPLNDVRFGPCPS